MKQKNDSKIIIRLPKELKAEFDKALALNDAVQSKVIRRLIKEYIKEYIKANK